MRVRAQSDGSDACTSSSLTSIYTLIFYFMKIMQKCIRLLSQLKNGRGFGPFGYTTVLQRHISRDHYLEENLTLAALKLYIMYVR